MVLIVSLFFVFLVCYTYLSGTFGSCQHGAFSHFFRLFSTFGVMHQNVVALGGVCVCFSKSVRKRQKCMGWGGIGDHIFEYQGRTFQRFRVFGPQGAPLTRADTNSQVFPWVLRHIVELEQSERT